MNERYQRQVILSEIGEVGQQKLKEARVLIVGAGGLGCPIALYLTSAGIGHLGIMDDDVVNISNLGRQVLYTENEVGQSKAICATRRLKALNGETDITPYPIRLMKDNADEIISHYDLVVDGCDNHITRYLISDTCLRWKKPYVYAAIGAFHGQIAILCHGKDAPTYRTLFPDEEAMCTIQSEKGVIGTTPAVVGSIAANEVLKFIIGYGDTLVSRLWHIDLLTLNTQIIQL